MTARLVGQYLSEYLGQNVVIENRVGAGGNVGMEIALNAPPDGYTIAFCGPNNAINATLYEKLPFDFIRDSVPVAGTMQLTNVMELNLDVPVKNLAEFIAYAKANPGNAQLRLGRPRDVAASVRRTAQGDAGIDIVHVPYRGSAPALTDLLAGRVQALFDNIPGAVGQVRAGKVRALGVTAPQRVPALPDVPAMAETVPGYEASVWYGIAAPRGTPPDIVAKLNGAVNAVLANPKLQARLHELGGDPMPMTPDTFGRLVADETQKWAKVIRSANIHLE